MVNQLISPELENLSGMIETKLNVQETSKSEYELVMITEGQNLMLPTGAQPAKFETLNANLPAVVSVSKTTITKATLKNAIIKINDHAPVNLAGNYEEQADKKRFAIFLKQLKLGDLDTILQALNIDTLKEYRGAINVTALAVLDAKTETTSINAQADISDLRVSGEPAARQDSPLRFKADTLIYNAAADYISLKTTA